MNDNNVIYADYTMKQKIEVFSKLFGITQNRAAKLVLEYGLP